VSDLIHTLRAIIREELARQRLPELAIVTEVQSRDSDDGDGNHQVNARLRSSGLELQRVPVAVGRLGLSSLPCVGDLVMIAFSQGDLQAPVVLGSVYDDSHRPPVGKPEETVYQPPDAGDASIRRFHLELPSGSLLTIDDDNVTIESGGTEVVIARDGDVTIKSAAKVTVESSSDMTLKSGGKLALEATGDVVIKGANATVEGQGSAKIKGPSLSLAGNTQFSPS
jgi:uncharacterized protein involved in type VI secretion and phage assembly